METFQVDILNPKAVQLLKDLAELKLISIKRSDDKFLATVEKLRKKASTDVPSLEEITAEVENIRTKRYAK